MKHIIILLLFFCAGIAQETGARYLIITHDNYYSAVLPLAEWKHKKGMRTKVVKLSEIGSSAPNILAYIQDAYDNWPIRPQFVLLVGAPNYLPLPYVDGVHTDNYYTNMDSTIDIQNEILSGRLTVHNTTEAQTVVNKILLYERTPTIDISNWYINACCIVREDYDDIDDSIYWSDVKQARDYMRAAGYDTIDTLSRAAGDNADDVIQCVNEGRGIVLFRGQGVGNWWSPFDCDPDDCENGSYLPIVLSLTCVTMGTGSTPAGAEQWLLTGTPTEPRGAAGYFATTTVVIGEAHLRSAVSKGFFDGLFRKRMTTFGEACEMGRLNVYILYSDTAEYRGFTTLGDPEMNIWTSIPAELEVTHSPFVDTGAQSCTVTVYHNGSPLRQAIVCCWIPDQDPELYVVKSTDNSGNAVLDIAPQTEGDTMYITVTRQNCIPYEGSAIVSSNVPSEPVIASVVKSGNDVDLTWYGVTTDENGFPVDIDHYVVYRNVSPSFIPGSSDSIGVTAHPDTTFADEGVLGSTENYYYLLKAVSTAGKASGTSNMGYKLNELLNENP
jgi:hypothetical protein